LRRFGRLRILPRRGGWLFTWFAQGEHLDATALGTDVAHPSRLSTRFKFADPGWVTDS